MPSTSDLPEDLQPLAYREAIELRDSRWGRDVADLIAYLDGLVAAGPARRFSPQRPERRLLIPIAVALAVVAVIVAAVLVAPRLNDSGSDVTAQGPTTGPTSAGSPTTPTSGGPTTATEPAGDTKSPGLRKVFEGITAKRCNDRTGDWPGVNDFDAKQVIGCDFPDYTVDFHQWLNAREMQRYESAAYRTFRKWTERNTHWDGPDGHPVGDYYVWQVQGGYEILWTIDDLLMSGRMFAAVKSSDAIEKMWSNDAGVYANPKYLT